MDGIIHKCAKAVVLSAGLVTFVGCYRDVVDTCYPDRYNFVAHNTVCATLKAQVNNGHVLDQTLWNWHFEEGKANLNDAGQEQVQALLRRRPQPDTVIYLQTAQVGSNLDVKFDPAAPEKTAVARKSLDDARRESVKTFVKALGASDLNVQIMDPHDPTQISLPAEQGARTIGLWNANAQGKMSSSGGGGGGGGGAAGGGGAGGGGGR
jgi:uncharacterized membrane protein YgcG